MGARINMTGERFGTQVVLAAAGVDLHRQALWLVRCDCGTERKVQGGKLRRGESTSCGCGKPAKCAAANIKHGAASRGRLTPEYRTWSNMIFRCENPAGKSYRDYGGRGIRVCERWRNDFAVFLADMGLKPSAKHEVDRINNDGDYEPNNCRWATRRQNARNKRSNVLLEAQGRRMLLVDWARELGVCESTISQRLLHGWSVERAVTTPPRRRGHS